MLYVIFVCCWMSLCFAGQDDQDLEIFLTNIIKEDNNQPVKYFRTYQEVELKKRELNNGMLPLSLEVKESIKNHLWSHFEKEYEAIIFFQKVAQKHTLYPLSVEKIIDMIQSKYASYPTADIAPSLRVVKVKAPFSVKKIESELSQLELHCSCISHELDRVRKKIKRRKSRKHRTDIGSFKIIPLNEIPLRGDLGFDDDV